MEYVNPKLKEISELFMTAESLHTWYYDTNGLLLASNCPHTELLDAAFELCDCKHKMLLHFNTQNNPFMASLPFGLIWLASSGYTVDGEKRIYVLGPMLTSSASIKSIREELCTCVEKFPQQISLNSLSKVISDLPIVPSNILQRYAVMLQYIITGEQLSISDIVLNSNPAIASTPKWLETRDRQSTWMAETALFQMVREGNLNYHSALSAAQKISNGVPLSAKVPLRQTKNSAIVFISLCVRAAIEGGLTPEQAYSLGDMYIQNVEDCLDFSEIITCNHDMYQDFIKRVHKRRSNPNLSPQIQKCCDYIELHVDEKLRVKDLAECIGYTEYYFSKKFKRETGMSVNAYIKHVKIERAKLLLTTTDNDIQQISELLQFSSRGYFGEIFSEVTGSSPALYRQKNKRP